MLGCCPWNPRDETSPHGVLGALSKSSFQDSKSFFPAKASWWHLSNYFEAFIKRVQCQQMVSSAWEWGKIGLGGAGKWLISTVVLKIYSCSKCILNFCFPSLDVPLHLPWQKSDLSLDIVQSGFLTTWTPGISWLYVIKYFQWEQLWYDKINKTSFLYLCKTQR